MQKLWTTNFSLATLSSVPLMVYFSVLLKKEQPKKLCGSNLWCSLPTVSENLAGKHLWHVIQFLHHRYSLIVYPSLKKDSTKNIYWDIWKIVIATTPWQLMLSIDDVVSNFVVAGAFDWWCCEQPCGSWCFRLTMLWLTDTFNVGQICNWTSWYNLNNVSTFT